MDIYMFASLGLVVKTVFVHDDHARLPEPPGV
jgi:hypothetical protein